jgi:hypothetical protein
VVHWFIQDANLGDSQNNRRLVYAIEEAGHTAHVARYVPFGGMDYAFLPTDAPVAFYGALAVVLDWQRRGLAHRPFAWCDWDRLRCQTYFAPWREHLLQRDHAFVTLERLRADWDALVDAHGRDDALFIRPDANDKSFAGAVVRRSQLDGWWARAAADAAPTDLCVVAPPQRLEAEWRLVIAGTEVAAASQYRQGGAFDPAPGCPDDVRDFAAALARRWTPHPVFCMDLARTDEGLRLIEIGSVNCSGFYACDLRAVVDAVSRAAERAFGGVSSGP